MLTKEQKRILCLSSLGGLLEFYDFIIYALLATYISAVFFPAKAALNSLIMTFGTFAIGYLARPFGGMLCGHFGDRYGRKKTFTATILIMAVSTFAVGLIPSYQSIGIAAPLLLTLLRALQGVSVGGEIPGATTYISEIMPEHKGFGVGVVFCLLTMGNVVGGLVQVLLLKVFSHQQIIDWAWRLPFFLGGIFGIISFYLRKKLIESPIFMEMTDEKHRFPLAKVIKHYFPQIVCAIIFTSLLAVVIVLLFLFMPAYLTKILHYHTDTLIWINTLGMFCASVGCIFFGWLSDKIKRRTLLMIVSLFALVCAWPIFHYYVGHTNAILVPLIPSVILLGLALGIVPAVLAELFPVDVRYSGIGFAYNIGFAVFGGLTPLIAVVLIKWTGQLTAPSYLLIAISLCALFLMPVFKRIKRCA